MNPPKVKINTQLFIQKELLYLIWYTANHLMEFFYYQHIWIKVLLCESQMGKVSVFPGLLSMYMMAYRVVPLVKLHCNITGYPAIPVSSHLYATIKLEMQSQVVINFTMDIDVANKTLNTTH